MGEGLNMLPMQGHAKGKNEGRNQNRNIYEGNNKRKPPI